MKTLKVLFFVSLTLSFYSAVGLVVASDHLQKTDDQLFSIASNVVNNYLEVKLNQSLLNTKDSVRKEFSVWVRVLNKKGVQVYTATKNVYQFSIFTGGFPEGDYEISCQMGTVVSKQSFSVKH